MEWEEKRTWDKQVEIMKKQILPQMASSFRPNVRAWRKAPENWLCLGQTNADVLTDWLKFEKQVRADEQFADAEPPSRKPAPVLYPIQTLEECWRKHSGPRIEIGCNGFNTCLKYSFQTWLLGV